MTNLDGNQSTEPHIPDAYLSSFVGKLMGSPKFSDLKLVCQGQVINVHKAIVCIQSPVLEKAVTSDFFVEAREGKIEMENFDFPTVERMVEFMYTGKYSIAIMEAGSSQPGSATPSEQGDEVLIQQEVEGSEHVLEILRAHVRVNAIGDYYDIPRLRDFATREIKEIFAGMDFSADAMCGVLQEAHEASGDSSLFQMLASIAARHLDELVVHEEFATLDIMKDVFGRHLLFTSASLLKRAKDALENEDHLHRQTKKQLSAARGRADADEIAIGNFVKTMNNERCTRCNCLYNHTASWSEILGPSSLRLVCLRPARL